jgi:LL-diaminopimelate aminotransferase
MANINHHYLKLQGAYLFPEIAKRVSAFLNDNPAAQERLIRCGIGDVSEPLPPAVVQAMHRAVDDLAQMDTFHGYGPPPGYPWLRSAIANTDYRDRGIDVDDDEIFLSDGSKTDCGAILDILGAGNVTAVTDPVYPVYVDTNVMAGHTGERRIDGRYEGLVTLPCTRENDFVPDIPKDAKLDVIYLCYPNNPTGGTITRAQLTDWVNYALRHDAIILYDAAYQAFIREPDMPWSIYEIDGARQCAMEFHSFSKNGGFTGVRCGYTICPRELQATAPNGDPHPLHPLWMRRWSTKANGVSYITQRGAEALYTPDGLAQTKVIVDHYLENARLLKEGCEAIGLDAIGGSSSPYVWVGCPEGQTSWGFFDRMLTQANVVITPGVGFGACGEGYIRISAFQTRANVLEVVERMKQL